MDPVFLLLMRHHGIPEPTGEHRFHPDRKWRFDYAWPEKKIALEVEGGTYGRGKPCPVCKRRAPGAHSSVSGMQRDMEKYNQATLMGWRVYRCTPQQLHSDELTTMMEQAITTQQDIRYAQENLN